MIAHQSPSRILAHLREVLPPIYPIRLRWQSFIDGTQGTTHIAKTKVGRMFVITLDNALRAPSQRSRMVDTLIHEYAHALTPSGWATDHPNHNHHGPEWGVQYAAVYCQVMQTT